MEAWCPYCNAKTDIPNEDVMDFANDWFEDVVCPECEGKYDLFIELEPTALSYAQRKHKCAGCGLPTKHIKLRRNPYALDSKKYCEECFTAYLDEWKEKAKEEAEANKPVKRGRKPKKEKEGND